ncbi:MAG TPA: hypothetical protein VMH86_09610 [Rhizomicrobium sp.]|nr:hypothetical protein [Rhizomicrobium sp.]
MGAFEHIVVLLSFVYALAIAHVLTTAARLIGATGRVRFSWLHGYWMLNALIVLVMDWISYWDMHKVAGWSIASIGLVLTQSFLDYMQAALVCPEVPVEGTIDLPAFHRARGRLYIGAFAATAIMALVDNLYFGGGFDIGEYLKQNRVVIPMIAIALSAAIFRNRWVQRIAPVLMLTVWITYVIALQDTLN